MNNNKTNNKDTGRKVYNQLVFNSEGTKDTWQMFISKVFFRILWVSQKSKEINKSQRIVDFIHSFSKANTAIMHYGIICSQILAQFQSLLNKAIDTAGWLRLSVRRIKGR